LPARKTKFPLLLVVIAGAETTPDFGGALEIFFQRQRIGDIRTVERAAKGEYTRAATGAPDKREIAWPSCHPRPAARNHFASVVEFRRTEVTNSFSIYKRQRAPVSYSQGMDFLIDLHQQGQINQAQNRAAQAQSVAEQLRWELDTLKRKSDSLTLACQALWEIVRTQTGLSDTAILEKMRDIDIRDGKLDNRITRRVAECPRCGRKSNASRKDCIYCGALLPTENVFEKC
jgi:hypothetical protein